MSVPARTVYVSNGRAGTVTPIAAATSTPGPPIPVGRGPGVIVITPDGKTAYVTGHRGVLTAGRPAWAVIRRAQRIRSGAASGWSRNSCAIRPTQPPTPDSYTAQSMALATTSAVGTSDGCN